MLATHRYIVDIREWQVSIWNRSTGTCKLVYCEWRPDGGLYWPIYSAYIEQNRLVCGATRLRNCSGGDQDFIIIDLDVGEIVERYFSEGDIFNNETIRSIVMKSNDIFYICHDKLYWSNLKNRTPVYLEDALPDDHLTIHDNYLFVKHCTFYGKGNRDLSIWDIETKKKVATIKNSRMEEAMWENGYLFTNTEAFLVRYDIKPDLEEVNVMRCKL